MANRYWVSLTDRSWSSTAGWSETSGGASGASVPGAGDTAIFDYGNADCVIDADVSIDSITTTGYNGDLVTLAPLDCETLQWAGKRLSLAESRIGTLSVNRTNANGSQVFFDPWGGASNRPTGFVTTPGSGSFTVTFRPVPGATRYRVDIDRGNGSWAGLADITTNSRTVTGAQNNIDYLLRFAAVINGVTGPWSEAVLGRTLVGVAQRGEVPTMGAVYTPQPITIETLAVASGSNAVTVTNDTEVRITGYVTIPDGITATQGTAAKYTLTGTQDQDITVPAAGTDWQFSLDKPAGQLNLAGAVSLRSDLLRDVSEDDPRTATTLSIISTGTLSIVETVACGSIAAADIIIDDGATLDCYSCTIGSHFNSGTIRVHTGQLTVTGSGQLGTVVYWEGQSAGIPAPTSLVATALSAASIRVTVGINSASTASDTYVIERSATGISLPADWTAISVKSVSELGSGTSYNYDDTGLTPTTTWYYRAFAYQGDDASTATPTVSARTLPAVPTGLRAGSVTASSIPLSWNAAAFNFRQIDAGFGTSAIRGGFWCTELNLAIAVGDSGKLATSPDGITWTQRTSSFGTSYIFGCFWCAELGIAIIAGESGKLATSPDGITWTQRTSGFGTSNIFGGFWCAELNLAIAFGDSGKLATSPDGITWTQRTSSFGTTNIRGGFWCAELNLAIVVGDSGKLATSPDGITWTQRTSGFGTSAILGSCWCAELNLAIVAGLSGKLAVSSHPSYVLEQWNENAPVGVWTQIYSGTAVTYTDTNLTANTAYTYRVKAVDTGVTPAVSSAWSAGVVVTTAPNTPASFTATAVSDSQIDLGWTAPANGAAGYLAQISTDQAVWSDVYDGTGTSASVTGLTASTTYWFQLAAYNVDMAYSNFVTASATTQANAAGAPVLTAGTATVNSLVMSWSSVSGATGYRLERSATGTSGWTAVYTGTALTYTNTGLTAGTTYYYRVFATNTGGDSPASNTVNKMTLCSAPTGVTATAADQSQVLTVSWTAVTGAASYLVEWSANGTSGWTAITPNATAASQTQNVAAWNTTRYYRVTAVNASGNSAVSANASAKTPPAAPTNFTATVISASQIDLSLTAPTGATKNRFEYKPSSGSTWTQAGTPGTGTTISVTGLLPNTAYDFRASSDNT